MINQNLLQLSCIEDNLNYLKSSLHRKDLKKAYKLTFELIKNVNEFKEELLITINENCKNNTLPNQKEIKPKHFVKLDKDFNSLSNIMIGIKGCISPIFCSDIKLSIPTLHNVENQYLDCYLNDKWYGQFEIEEISTILIKRNKEEKYDFIRFF